MFNACLKLKILAPLIATLLLLGAALERNGHLASPSPSTSTLGTQEQEQQMPKPGAEHKWLSGRVGTWKVASKMKFAPGTAWTESTATETCTMGCGGFWQFTIQKGTFMNMPFEGRMQLGYDQTKKKFVGTWIDNFGSYLSIMEGTLSADKKVLTLHSDMLDPQSGKSMKVRMETTFESSDKSTFKMFMPGPDGKDFQSMEQTSIRSK